MDHSQRAFETLRYWFLYDKNLRHERVNFQFQTLEVLFMGIKKPVKSSIIDLGYCTIGIKSPKKYKSF